MIQIRTETQADVAARERLLDRAFGKSRRRKTSERLREGRLPSEGLAFSAVDEKGRLVGTLRLWDVVAGSAGPALLLGPLAVDCRHQGKGIGAALMRHAIAEAKLLGHAAIILVGDAPYYARFGFSGAPMADLHLPGPVDRARFLGIELIPGALDGAEGFVAGCGRREAAQRQAA
ncbi:GNAT family N-acetyltransferase [Aestuariivirga litoralis]|uniref:GNAT family N-acetyltransferase n=1 Tax=Aestuariivirga litoralis TaxID=2650924 RepID=A0A2W2AVA8_9HYPH|nr:N-acetyltransferase [Aestuariivirga litoralis]PZF76550.1 GNAT family N-acetyltransferase [Aestuariivirga litoralis]